MATRRNTAPYRPQDTRMQRDASLADNERAQQERAGELSMITAAETANDRDGVWDGEDGSLIEAGISEDEVETIRTREQITDTGDEIIEPGMASSPSAMHQVRSESPPADVEVTEHQRVGDAEVIEPVPDEDPEVAEALAVLARKGVSPDVTRKYVVERPRAVQRMAPVDERMVVVRINADLEPTIGQGEHSQWNFKKGRRYRVPMTVADHLDQRGFVSSWG